LSYIERLSNKINRRQFLHDSAAIAGVSLIGMSGIAKGSGPKNSEEGGNKFITIDQVNSDFEREALIRPFGFKGGYLTEIWQTIAVMRSTSKVRKIGLCTQNILWSDAKVFSSFSESGGNIMMYALTERALQLIKGKAFRTPLDLLDQILPEIYDYGKTITSNPELRMTFALNALVGVDNAAWLLYAHENKITDFDQMIPEEFRPALSHHHDRVASIPLMSYGIPIEEIKDAADQGYFFMKIKIGQPGTQSEMLVKDMDRLSAIHKAIGHLETPHTSTGKLPYYFDANGRYEQKETLLRLLDHAKKIGAFDQIVIIEEPFPESLELDVSDIGVRIAADESAHTDKDALKRIEMGYKAIALKAIAKTLSMTLRIARIAHEHNIPCFCADLTVNPILVEWNKAVAARLEPLPGLNMGLLETNGHQNYKDWQRMVSYYPYAGKSWTQTRDGLFYLDEEYYQKSGGIFAPSKHYEQMFLK
jgi:L-alanine-DL-glutamate epimerase-like enolase superfamily enzyme